MDARAFAGRCRFEESVAVFEGRSGAIKRGMFGERRALPNPAAAGEIEGGCRGGRATGGTP
ncbi:MAG: hypothetical protein BAA00_17615 [Parageobacillus thermoglucosidasius]|nr:MAG: hypothetical protein BAA00_17615 [Parageobacillus thermoglucosidasius]